MSGKDLDMLHDTQVCPRFVIKSCVSNFTIFAVHVTYGCDDNAVCYVLSITSCFHIMGQM